MKSTPRTLSQLAHGLYTAQDYRQALEQLQRAVQTHWTNWQTHTRRLNQRWWRTTMQPPSHQARLKLSTLLDFWWHSSRKLRVLSWVRGHLSVQWHPFGDPDTPKEEAIHHYYHWPPSHPVPVPESEVVLDSLEHGHLTQAQIQSLRTLATQLLQLGRPLGVAVEAGTLDVGCSEDHKTWFIRLMDMPEVPLWHLPFQVPEGWLHAEWVLMPRQHTDLVLELHPF